jgi:hypothetical protein
MNSEVIEDPIFSKLQFTSQWVSVGLVTDENFELVRQEYLRSEDQSSEHFRWGVFKDFLKKNSHMSKQTFFEIYELGKNDPDYPMGRAMRFDLIQRSDCPVELIDIAAADSDVALARHALKYKRIREEPKV